jgi:hypothetical protein
MMLSLRFEINALKNTNREFYRFADHYASEIVIIDDITGQC